MKTKLFKLMSVLFVAALTFGFTACGDDDDNESGGTSLTDEGKTAVMVDLALPSGTKWADKNIGADAPEASGE